MRLPVVLILVVLATLLSLSDQHVSLTFPPARNLNLDFLDNIRSNQKVENRPPLKFYFTYVLKGVFSPLYCLYTIFIQPVYTFSEQKLNRQSTEIVQSTIIHLFFRQPV